jgi:hypothetical protein
MLITVHYASTRVADPYPDPDSYESALIREGQK